MQLEEVTQIVDIACRYDRILQASGLEAACSAGELVHRLITMHHVKPLNLRKMLDAKDVDLVVMLGELQMGLTKAIK